MSKKTVPTLTLNGFISDPEILIIKLFEYFVTSDYSQSVFFYGNIASLNKILQEYGNDFNNVSNEVMVALDMLYNRYFKDVEVNCYVEELKVNGNTIYNLKTDITVVDDNSITHNLIKSIKTHNNKILNMDNNIEYLLS